MKNQTYKAYQYYLMGKDIPYPKDDVLFIEANINYNKLFQYEKCLLWYYIYSDDRLTGSKNCIDYLNTTQNKDNDEYNNIIKHYD